MKKQLTVLLLVLVLALTAAVGIACQPKTYSLTYYTGGGSGTAPSVELLEEGATVTVKANMFTAPEGKEFDGWSDGTNKYQPNDTFKMPASDVILTALWKDKSAPQPEYWTVTFKVGERTVKSVQVEKGQKIAAADIPTEAELLLDWGQNFEGWFVGEGESAVAFTAQTEITSNLEVIAKVTTETIEEVTITYVWGEGDNDSSESMEILGDPYYVSGIMQFGVMPPEGSEFAGWTLQGDKSGKVYEPDEEIILEEDMTFIAKWVKIAQQTWTVTFKVDERTVKSVQVEKGQKIAAADIPSEAELLLGWDQEFEGWFVGEGASAVAFTADTEITSDLVVIAKIGVAFEEVTIIYVWGEGANDKTTSTAVLGDPYELEGIMALRITPPENSELVGWKLKGDLSGKLYEVGEEITPEEDMTFVAEWLTHMPDEVVITYKAGEGEGSDKTVQANKGWTASVKSLSELGNPFTAPKGKIFIGWKLEGDSTEKVYAPGEDITPTAAMTFVAQWAAVVGAVDTTETATLVLTLGTNNGSMYIYNATTDKETEVKLTYTLTGTALVVTIGQDSFNGTLAENKITITLTYQSKSYVFQPAASVSAPSVTFDANGGTGNAPEIGELVKQSSGYYKLVLPQNTFVAPQGKEFDTWTLTINGKEDGKRKVGSSVMLADGDVVIVKALWKDSVVVEPDPLEGDVYVGNCTVPTTTIVGGLQGGGQTYVKFVVDLANLKVEYWLKDASKGVLVNATLVSSKPDAYGADASYLEVKLADNLAYSLLIKADKSKLAMYNTSDELLSNGEFTGEQTSVEKTINDYIGVYGGSGMTAGSNNIVALIVGEESFKLVADDGYILEYAYSDAKVTIRTVEGNLVVAYVNASGYMTISYTVTFTADDTANVEYSRKMGSNPTTASGTFKATQMLTVTWSLGEGVEGTAPEAQQIVPGVVIAEVPTDPTRFGYTFLGWFAPEATEAFNFETPITANITLTAKWEKIENVTVTFAANNKDYKGTAPESQTIAFNTKATKPADLTCEGYIFLGWFTTYAATTEFDFDSNVTADITIYAGWEKLVEITTVIPGQENATSTARRGEKITLGEAPEYLEGYTFVGWTVNNTSALNAASAEYPIGDKVDKLTITAVFTVVLKNGDNPEDTETWTYRTDNRIALDGGETVSVVDGVANMYDAFSIGIDIENKVFYYLDGMQAYSFTANDKETTLTFNGRGGATLGEHEGAYQTANTSSGIDVTLTFGSQEFVLKLAMDAQYNVTLAEYLEITINDAVYSFGLKPIDYETVKELIGVYNITDSDEDSYVLTVTYGDDKQLHMTLEYFGTTYDATDIVLNSENGLSVEFKVKMGVGSATTYTLTLASGAYTFEADDLLEYTIEKRPDSTGGDDADIQWVAFDDTDEYLNQLASTKTKLYFEKSIVASGTTFVGIELSLFNNSTLMLKPIYLNGESETIGTTSHNNVTKVEGTTFLKFAPVSSINYKGIVLGKDSNNNYYVTSLYYKTEVQQTTKLVIKTA